MPSPPAPCSTGLRVALLLALVLSAVPVRAQVVNDTFRVFTVHSPPEIARTDTILGQSPDWGQQPPPEGITAPLVLTVDSLGNPSTACGAPTIANPSALAGAIVLVERGLCEFESKALTVQDLGAVAFLVAQDDRVPDDDCETTVFMGCFLCHQGELPVGGFLPRCVAVALYPTLRAGMPATATLAPFFLGVATEPRAEEPRPLTLAVAQNPAAGPAAVTLTLARPTTVRLAVHDVLGREAARLHDGPLTAGSHTFASAAALPPGVYVVRVVGEGFTASRTLTVVR